MSGPAGAPLYKGEPLDADRGPGLGCFWSQVVVLVILVVLTPIGVANAWPQWLTTVMLFATLILLLLAGQTVIFLLRLVAADRRTRRRPMRATTPTVGQLEDSSADGAGTGSNEAGTARAGGDPAGHSAADEAGNVDAAPAGDAAPVEDATPVGDTARAGGTAADGGTGAGDVPTDDEAGARTASDEAAASDHPVHADGSPDQPDAVREPDQPPSSGMRQ